MEVQVTKKTMIAALDAAGIEYPNKANHATLLELYAPIAPQAEAPTTPDAPAPAATEVTGLKIEKDRPEQNGVKRPSLGGKCRAIWDALDAYRTETGMLPTSKVVKELAADEDWNPSNASIEYYQWRKYNGISGRVKDTAPVEA